MKKIVIGFIGILVALVMIGGFLWVAISRGDVLGLLICMVGPVAGLFAGQFVYDQLSRLIPARRPRQVDPEQAKRRAQRAAEKEEMRLCIEHAKRHLTGTDWRDPTGKKEFVDELYKGRVPEYLWYARGSQKPLEEELQAIATFFWGEQEGGWGNLQVIPPPQTSIGWVVRVRHAPRFEAEIEVNGKKLPLCQIGKSDFYMGLEGDSPCVALNRLFDQPLETPA